MPKPKPKRIRVISALDSDLIEPEYLQAHSVVLIDTLERAAEEADLTLNWETLKIKVKTVDPGWTYARASARIL